MCVLGRDSQTSLLWRSLRSRSVLPAEQAEIQTQRYRMLQPTEDAGQRWRRRD